jgi:hypothetical protein
LLQLALPKDALNTVIAAQGDWAQCPDAIATLLSAGPLGKTIFSFAGLHANAAAFAKTIDDGLALLEKQGITADAIASFKETMAEKTEEYKATWFCLI